MYRIAGLLTLPIRPGQTGLTTDSQHEPAIRLRFGTAALIPERAGAACFLSFQNCPQAILHPHGPYSKGSAIFAPWADELRKHLIKNFLLHQAGYTAG